MYNQVEHNFVDVTFFLDYIWPGGCGKGVPYLVLECMLRAKNQFNKSLPYEMCA